MIRLKDEAEWIEPCLQSIRGIFDEVVICVQPSTDRTLEIVCDLADSKTRIWEYPVLSWPNGEGYKYQDSTSINSRTYFYNWCLARTNYQHVCKWDGDMIAMDWLGEHLNKYICEYDTVIFHGVDVVQDLKHVGKRKYCAAEPRVFRVRLDTKYVNGLRCEQLQTPEGFTYRIQPPAFIHTKWAKSIKSATKAWPDDWKDQDHFKSIIKRAQPVEEYKGEYPSVLLGMM